ncbi:VirE N-terminal domain-containing protein [Prevotella sp. khp1]|uniref:BT4734/BF3469 family protein n=1 Tax=Prevotellaceae TaxID=171552 RepID=UPI000890F60D|nr:MULTISPECIES: BT4734/BF3469 family protein [Prevotellaceae]SDQ55811.1 VirE N-terminal domain-containing protein [Prevotella sp. khp1]
MFSYQQQLTDSRTRLITPEVFWAYCRAPQTIQLVTEARQALQNGDEKTYADKKKQLALMIFVGTFEEWEKELENKRTGEKRKETAMWRSQSHVHLNGLVVADYDHLQGDVRKIWAEAYERLSPEDQARIVLVYVTPSGQGLKPVFTADPAIGNLIDNQLDFSRKLGLPLDESCKDGSRGAFMTTADDIIYINEEKLFSYEDETFSARFDALYRDGQSQATQKDNLGSEKKIIESCGPLQDNYNGMPVMEIVDKWSQQHFASEGVSRHESSILLARDLLIMLDRDQSLVLSVLKAQPWVQAIIRERGEDVERTVSDAATYLKAQESQAAKKGQPWLPKISKEMQAIVEPLNSKISILNSDADIYSQLPLDKWADELLEMAQYYPCMKELFVNLHPHKLPAVLFSSGALFGTLMTRAWYHFWFDPKIIRRLNYCIFIIGDPGAGKHMIEEFYRLIADPIIQADQCMTDALNRYKESRTERTTSTKAQKAEALKKPEVGIRVHPARTATGEFIRHMLAAKEIIQGQPINLHMLSFDSELDNVNKNNKGGDWKDREIMELKAFHNEEDGQMYANQESISGMFNVYWNFIYTGTPYALHRKVNQRNFGTGMSSRLAVIPLPDRGKAKRHQEVIEGADETLKMWAYRLDKVAGEIPIEPLNDETYEWQTEHMDIAEFNHDKADRMLLKRIPYYGIGISLPFILMRHWQEWEQNRTLSMDDTDRRFCRLVMEIQYRSQQFFFGEMAFHYFADQDKEFVVRRRTTRYDECYRQLPEEFKAKHVVEIFGCSQPTASRNINRLLADGIIEHVDTHTYRKLLPELP